MISTQNDPVKQQVAAHWNRRAANFDEDFGHSIRTPAERAAWDRILDLMLPAADPLEVLDIGCGTGFLSLELAARGHPLKAHLSNSLIKGQSVRHIENEAVSGPQAFDLSSVLLAVPLTPARQSRKLV